MQAIIKLCIKSECGLLSNCNRGINDGERWMEHVGMLEEKIKDEQRREIEPGIYQELE